MKTNLEACYKKVWDFRNANSEFWPTPDTEGSLMYAFTEIGEAVSAYMRLEHPDHKRNNDHESTLWEELADTAIMLLTALGDTHPDDDGDKIDDPMFPMELRLRSIAFGIMELLAGEGRYSTVLIALRLIETFPDMDLEAEIGKRLDRIYEKHVKHAYEGQEAQA